MDDRVARSRNTNIRACSFFATGHGN